jgi:hypothetical protein
MAEKKELTTEERGVKALESIAHSAQDISDWLYDLDTKGWSTRLEWYLNEFYNIAKTKAVGTSTRPDKESEREA